MVVCRWTTQAEFRAMLVGVVLCVPNRFQFRLGTRLELEIPRNPTVVLFLKIPRVLCSHPLTGGPGFYFVSTAPHGELRSGSVHVIGRNSNQKVRAQGSAFSA